MTLTEQQLERLRVRVGLDKSDTSADADIQTAWDTSLNLAERLCNRMLEYKPAWIERFVGEGDYSLSLERYPVEAIASIEDDQSQVVDPSCYDYDKNSGVLFLRGHGDRWLIVTYGGGYNPIPGDLWLALLMTFDNVYSAAYTTTTGDDLAGRAIKALTVPDAGKVEYEASGDQYGAGGVEPVGLIPGGAVAILNLYRRVSV